MPSKIPLHFEKKKTLIERLNTKIRSIRDNSSEARASYDGSPSRPRKRMPIPAIIINDSLSERRETSEIASSKRDSVSSSQFSKTIEPSYFCKASDSLV